MQTIDFISTARWIESLFSEETVSILMERQILRASLGSDRAASPELVEALLRASHEVANVRSRLATHARAPAVLRAFKLDILLEPDWPVHLVRAVLAGRSGEEADVLLSALHRGWSDMTRCVDPIEQLTTPSEVVESEDFDEVLTVEIRASDEEHPTLDRVAEVLKDVQALYHAVSTARSDKEAAPLRVVYTGSGSTVRFDFRGLDGCIKELKRFVVDAWKIIRHRRAEEVRVNLEVTLQSLEVLGKVDSQAKKGTLQPEDASALRKAIVGSTLGLFQAGATIREIRAEETVENEKLLEQVMQKALPAPKDGKTEKKATKRSTKARTGAKDKSSK